MNSAMTIRAPVDACELIDERVADAVVRATPDLELVGVTDVAHRHADPGRRRATVATCTEATDAVHEYVNSSWPTMVVAGGERLRHVVQQRPHLRLVPCVT